MINNYDWLLYKACNIGTTRMDSATLDAPEKLQVFNQLHGKTPTNSCWFQGSQNGLDTSSSFILKMQPSKIEIMMQMLAQLFFFWWASSLFDDASGSSSAPKLETWR